MKFIDFIKKAWAWIVKAVQDVYNLVYTEVGMILSFFKSPDKTKYSAKRIAALGLLVSGIIFLPSVHELIPALVASVQFLAGFILLVVAAATKT